MNKLKSIYKARISGSLLLAFVLGAIAKTNFAIGVITLVVVPLAVLWFMGYDEAKYKKFEEGQTWKISMKN